MKKRQRSAYFKIFISLNISQPEVTYFLELYITFRTYSSFTSSQGRNPLGPKIEAFQRAPLATITDDAPTKVYIQISNVLRAIKRTCSRNTEIDGILGIKITYNKDPTMNRLLKENHLLTTLINIQLDTNLRT